MPEVPDPTPAVRRPHCLATALLALCFAGSAGAQAPQPVAVEVAPAVEGEIAPTSVILGRTEPHRRSLVAASIEGHVVEFAAREGRFVRRGEVLARLRDKTVRLEIEQAEAALEEIRARLAQARKDLERTRTLHASGARTEKELDAAVLAERTLALAERQAKARLEVLRDDLEKKTVRAPFDGWVTREHSEVGEWVARGAPVAELVDVGRIYVRVNIPERYVRFVETGTKLRFRAPAARDAPFTAEVVSVSVSGDTDTRTFAVRLELENDGTLRAGMTAHVEVPASRPAKVLLVPKDAILKRGDQEFVFVAGAGGSAELRPVRTGPASGSSIAVLEGLEPGMQVIVRGNERLRPGIPLKILSSEPAAAKKTPEEKEGSAGPPPQSTPEGTGGAS